MSYQDIYREKNEEVAERCELVMNRIAEIEKEEAAGEPYISYFKKSKPVYSVKPGDFKKRRKRGVRSPQSCRVRGVE